jgi:hypothetical protein
MTLLAPTTPPRDRNYITLTAHEPLNKALNKALLIIFIEFEP